MLVDLVNGSQSLQLRCLTLCRLLNTQALNDPTSPVASTCTLSYERGMPRFGKSFKEVGTVSARRKTRGDSITVREDRRF